MTSVRKRRIVCFLAVVMAFGIVFTAMPYAAYAAGSGLNFDTTDVLDDLTGADNFDILNYPFDGTGKIKHPEILNVAEYCYSYRVNARDNYGLYLYFYNPQGFCRVSLSLFLQLNGCMQGAITGITKIRCRSNYSRE